MEIDPDAPVTIYPFRVTCLVGCCVNYATPLDVRCTSSTPTVVCGPCTQPISDLVLLEGV